MNKDDKGKTSKRNHSPIACVAGGIVGERECRLRHQNFISRAVIIPPATQANSPIHDCVLNKMVEKHK